MIPLLPLRLRLIPILIHELYPSKEAPSITKILHHSTWLAVDRQTPSIIHHSPLPLAHLQCKHTSFSTISSQQTSSSSLLIRPATITHIRPVSTMTYRILVLRSRTFSLSGLTLQIIVFLLWIPSASQSHRCYHSRTRILQYILQTQVNRCCCLSNA
jgi:hypothetical protein